MILIISGRPENIASFDMIADHTVEQHVGWKLVGAVRVTTELGGVFHALVVDLGGARTALFWDRGSVRFAIAPLWGSKGDQMHNVVCSCSECQMARATLAPGEAAKGLDSDPVLAAEADLRAMMTNATDVEELAALQLMLSDVEDELRAAVANQNRLEAKLAAIVTRLKAITPRGMSTPQ